MRRPVSPASSPTTSSANPESHPYNGLPLATLARPGLRCGPSPSPDPRPRFSTRSECATRSERSAGVEHGQEHTVGGGRRAAKRCTRRPRRTLKGAGGSQGHFTPAESSISVLTPQCEMALGRIPGVAIGQGRSRLVDEGSFSRLDPTRQGPEEKGHRDGRKVGIGHGTGVGVVVVPRPRGGGGVWRRADGGRCVARRVDLHGSAAARRRADLAGDDGGGSRTPGTGRGRSGPARGGSGPTSGGCRPDSRPARASDGRLARPRDSGGALAPPTAEPVGATAVAPNFPIEPEAVP